MAKTKNFLDEIVACLLTRRDEWTIDSDRLRHESGVIIHTNCIMGASSLRFNPSFELTSDEKSRIYRIIQDLRRLHIMEKLEVTQIDNRVSHDHLEKTNQLFFANVMHSIRSDPESWVLGDDTLKHTSGIEIWAANKVDSRRFWEPRLELADHEKQTLDDAIEQHKRYKVLKQINEKLPQLEASAKTWGSRCPYCLDRPEGECYRCECDILLHLSCAQEIGTCPVCNESLGEKFPPTAITTKIVWWQRILSFLRIPVTVKG